MKSFLISTLGLVVGLCAVTPADAALQFDRGIERLRGNQVCVYKDINYQGAEQCYSGGAELANLGNQRNSISSIRVYGRTTVTVYENSGFGGHSAQFDSDVPDLGRQMMQGNTSWSDRIESLRIIGDPGSGNTSGGDRRNPVDMRRNPPGRVDQVCVYKDINYQGAEQCYRAGAEVANLGDQSRSISSIRVYGRTTVTVYEDSKFGGRSAQFSSNVPDLGRRMMAGNTSWSDHIESLRIVGDPGSGGFGGFGNPDIGDRRNPVDLRSNQQQQPQQGICVYSRPNYQGDSECWNRGENISDIARQTNWNGGIASIRLFGSAVAVVFQEAEYRGESLTVDRNIPDLAVIRRNGNGNRRNPGNWDHQISSVQVQEQRRNR